MPNVLILCTNSDEEEAYVRLLTDAQLQSLQLVLSVNDADIILGEPALIVKLLPDVPLNKHLWIQSIYAGVEKLIEYYHSSSVIHHPPHIITNIKSVFGPPMTEYVFAYILAHEKQIFQRKSAQENHEYSQFPVGNIHGKTIGIIGYGDIGQTIGRMAKVFGMRVVAFSRQARDPSATEIASADEYYHCLDELLTLAAKCHYIVCVLPSTLTTTNLLSWDFFHACQSSAVLLNIGRGNCIDEEALIACLNEKRLAGAVLDVTKEEPLPPSHPLWTTDNLVLTFHTSGKSVPHDIWRVFEDNYQRYIEGQGLCYVVDVWEAGY